MSDLKDYEARLGVALARIANALKAAPSGETQDGAASRIAELEAEVAYLNAGLAALKMQRDRDVAQLDALISQLRPLIEDAPNA